MKPEGTRVMSGGNTGTAVIPQGRSRLPGRAVIGVLSAFLLYVTATHLPAAIRAGLRHCTRGYWVATTKRCARSACTWTGQFQSPKGHVVLSSAQYVGRLPVGVHTGTSVTALFPGGSGLVFPPTGSDLWISLLVTVIVAALGVYWSSHRLIANHFRQHKPTP
jgi:hypothetical protein